MAIERRPKSITERIRLEEQLDKGEGLGEEESPGSNYSVRQQCIIQAYILMTNGPCGNSMDR